MRALIFIFSAIIVLSCKDDDKGPFVCNTEDPLAMPWMQMKIMTIKQGSHESESFIQQYDVNGVYYFYFATCCETCDPPNWFYDCAGNQVELQQVYKMSPISPATIIWRGDNFKCLLM